MPIFNRNSKEPEKPEPTVVNAEAEPLWNRTIGRTELLKLLNSPMYEEPENPKYGQTVEGRPAKYGWYKKRHVIGRDERINKGVYLGAGDREEIVVDGIKNPEAYDRVYQKLFENVKLRQADQRRRGQPDGFKNGVLSDVYETVLQTLEFDPHFASSISQQFRGQKVDLTLWLEDGKGVCRHQALLAGYLLERLKDEGYVNGNVSVDRNSVPGVGAHAWVRYENSGGEVFILDPAQQFAGRLSDVPDKSWPYERPNENPGH